MAREMLEVIERKVEAFEVPKAADAASGLVSECRVKQQHRSSMHAFRKVAI